MFCPKCVAQNPDSNKFCGQCGTQLIGSDKTAAIPRVTLQFDDSTSAVVPPVDLSFEANKFVNADQCRKQLAQDHTLLVEVQGPSAGATYLLTRPEETVGRNPSSHIFLDDVTVSRRHCVFKTDFESHELAVIECGSLNGTFVNGSRTDKQVLEDGDIVQVGKFRLQVLRSTAVSHD